MGQARLETPALTGLLSPKARAMGVEGASSRERLCGGTVANSCPRGLSKILVSAELWDQWPEGRVEDAGLCVLSLA